MGESYTTWEISWYQDDSDKGMSVLRTDTMIAISGMGIAEVLNLAEQQLADSDCFYIAGIKEVGMCLAILKHPEEGRKA